MKMILGSIFIFVVGVLKVIVGLFAFAIIDNMDIVKKEMGD